MIDRIAAMQHGMRPGLLLAVAALLLAGCATMAPQTPEEAVAQRAQARWDALLAGNAEEAYNYYSPGYRSAVSLEAFRQRLANQRVRWKKAEFQGVECQEQVCHPRVEVTYDYRMPVQGVGTVTSSQVIEEDWVETDDEWSYVPPQSGGLR